MLLLANKMAHTSARMNKGRKFSDEILTLLQQGKGLRIRAGIQHAPFHRHLGCCGEGPRFDPILERKAGRLVPDLSQAGRPSIIVMPVGDGVATARVSLKPAAE